MSKVRITAALGLLVIGLLATGCGDDSDAGESSEAPAVVVPGGEEASALQDDIADLSDEEQVARVGEAWAEPFGNGDEAMCGYLHPDRTPEACVEAGYLEGGLTQSSELQASFAGSTVESVKVRGETAVAKFSNGDQVLLSIDPDGAWKVLETPRATSSGSDEVVQPE